MADATGNGGVVIGLNVTLDTDLRGGIYTPMENTFTISEGLKDSLMNGYLYANIHTAAVPSGEIRGQVLRVAFRHGIAAAGGGLLQVVEMHALPSYA